MLRRLPPASLSLTLLLSVDPVYMQITAAQWRYIPPLTLSGLTCRFGLSSLADGAWDHLSPAQFRSLPTELFSNSGICFPSSFWLTMNGNKQSNWAYITASQLGAADAEFCRQMLPPTASLIPLSSWANASWECVRGISFQLFMRNGVCCDVGLDHLPSLCLRRE